MNSSSLYIKEAKAINQAKGSLLIAESIPGIKFGEIAEVELKTGEVRRARVLEVNRDKALIQLFEGSTGLNVNESRIRFLGKGIELGVSPDILGRIFDGLGRPIEKSKNTKEPCTFTGGSWASFSNKKATWEGGSGRSRRTSTPSAT